MSYPIITTHPWTRTNDRFIFSSELNASPTPKLKHPIVTSQPLTIASHFQADFYKYIACDIAAETVLDYPYPYITEKSLRAFACKRILIVLGPVGVLQLLRTRGFETFGDLIDESYDTITDPTKRIIKVSEEIHKLCEKPLTEIVEYVKHIQPRLERNFTTLKNLQHYEIEQIQHQLNYDPN